MKRYIKSNLGYYNPYTVPMLRSEVRIEFIAPMIASQLKHWTKKYNTPITTEQVIESFRLMGDRYDDFWVRGLTKKEEKGFVDELLAELRKYGIDEVIDNIWT